MSTIAPYGTWQSPITAADVAVADERPAWLTLRGDQLWWTQSRPEQGGRVALLRAPLAGGAPVEVLGAEFNVRNRVHEYGGLPWAIVEHPDGAVLVFTNWADQRIYAVPLIGDEPKDQPLPITPEPVQRHGWRYTELVPAPGADAVWCVRETLTGDRPTDVRRELVSVPLSGAGDPAAIRTLAASHRFMSAPRPSPDGTQLAWLGWDHPAMPWDGTELCLAPFDGGTAGEHRVLAGGPAESVCQFEWEDSGDLLVLTDPDGWWNLHRVRPETGAAHNLAPRAEEFGGPLWKLGTTWFAQLGGGRHAVLRGGRLALLDEQAGEVRDLDVPLPHWAGIRAAAGLVAGIAAGPRQEPTVCTVDLRAPGAPVLREHTAHTGRTPAAEYLPLPVERVFTDEHGNRIPAFVYPPTNPDFQGPDQTPAPYLVHAHGGPTNREAGGLDLEFAYFTSRGIGVLAVNYGGSSGYGRAFRERLREQWGVVDVTDCAAAINALVAEGGADGDRLAVRGGSAGGWTAAASLTSVDTYRCGTVMYPILDLTGWTANGGETHDFESRYVDGLVGSPTEHAQRYRDRSPANNAERLTGPVLMLQGLEDEICPPAQADRFMAGLAGRGIPHAYLRFAGEQHGFRKAETIKAALQAELSFYGQVFGFSPPEVPVLELAE